MSDNKSICAPSAPALHGWDRLSVGARTQVVCQKDKKAALYGSETKTYAIRFKIWTFKCATDMSDHCFMCASAILKLSSEKLIKTSKLSLCFCSAAVVTLLTRESLIGTDSTPGFKGNHTNPPSKHAHTCAQIPPSPWIQVNIPLWDIFRSLITLE